MDEVQEIFEHVQDIIERGIPVIVEGKKDAAALREFGVQRIIELDAYYKTIELVAHEREVALLVDLDKEGKKKYARLNDELSKRGVRINNNLRHFLFKHTKVRQIEGLTHYFS